MQFLCSSLVLKFWSYICLSRKKKTNLRKERMFNEETLMDLGKGKCYCIYGPMAKRTLNYLILKCFGIYAD